MPLSATRPCFRALTNPDLEQWHWGLVPAQRLCEILSNHLHQCLRRPDMKGDEKKQQALIEGAEYIESAGGRPLLPGLSRRPWQSAPGRDLQCGRALSRAEVRPGPPVRRLPPR
jgi:hypothetical protein